jgi:hypothetical protein
MNFFKWICVFYEIFYWLLMFLFIHILGNGIRQMYHASSASALAGNTIKAHGEGKVARWAVCFDRLLEDKTGLEIFRVRFLTAYIELFQHYGKSVI